MNYNDRAMLVQDLADYLNVSAEFVEAGIVSACEAYDNPEKKGISTQWTWMHGQREGTPEEYEFFYATNFYYLFDLIAFAGCFDITHAGADQYIKGRCLDYGCGIGTVALAMFEMQRVVEVHAADIGIILLDFLKWRIEKHGLDGLRVIDVMASGRRAPHLALARTPYDFIYARDVFEHAHNRLEIMDSLIAALKPDGVLCESTPIWDWKNPEDPYKFIKQCGADIPQKEYDIWDKLRDAGFTMISEAPSPTYPGPLTTKCWQRR